MSIEEDVSVPILGEEAVQIGETPGGGEGIDVEVDPGRQGGKGGFRGMVARGVERMRGDRVSYKDLTDDEKRHEKMLHAHTWPVVFLFTSMLVFHMFMGADIAGFTPVIQNTFAFLISYAVINGAFFIWYALTFFGFWYAEHYWIATARNSRDRHAPMLGALLIYVIMVVMWGGYYGHFAGINPHFMLNQFDLDNYRNVVSFGESMLPLLGYFGLKCISAVVEPPWDNYSKRWIV